MNESAQLLLAVVFSGSAATAHAAQDSVGNYPIKPVRWVVGFAPGASNDVIARTVGARLSVTWGQQFIIDNCTGAAGMIAGELVARAVPDGYTLLLTTGGPNIIGPLLARKPVYRTQDFDYVAVAAYSPFIIIVTPSLAAKTIRELVDYMKANPGKMNWGSAGVNSSPHVALATFAHATGVRVNHVPYKGSALAIIDVVSGQIDATSTTAASAEVQIRSNRVRVIAVAGPKRVPAIPGVPTLAEEGIKDGDALVWFGMAAPPGTPQAIVRKLNAGVNNALANPDVQRRLTDLGMEIVGGSIEDTAKFMREETSRIRDLIKAGVLKQE